MYSEVAHEQCQTSTVSENEQKALLAPSKQPINMAVYRFQGTSVPGEGDINLSDLEEIRMDVVRKPAAPS